MYAFHFSPQFSSSALRVQKFAWPGVWTKLSQPFVDFKVRGLKFPIPIAACCCECLHFADGKCVKRAVTASKPSSTGAWSGIGFNYGPVLLAHDSRLGPEIEYANSELVKGVHSFGLVSLRNYSRSCCSETRATAFLCQNSCACACSLTFNLKSISRGERSSCRSFVSMRVLN